MSALVARLRAASPVTLVGGVAGTAAAVWLIAQTLGTMYFTPKGEAEAQVVEHTQRIASLVDRLDDKARVEQKLREVTARTLGGDRESVDHRLRTRLNRIVEAIGLTETSVGTGRTSAKGSPARSEFRGRTRRALRDEIDFVELEGVASGKGSIEQVVRFVDAIVEEPWIKRLDQVRLEPQGNGEQFDVTVRLTTMFLPGREPAAIPQGPEHPGDVQAYAALVGVNPFRLPSPEVVAVAPPPSVEAAPPPPAPPSFPWAQWALTGVAESAAGPEAWLRNRASGETRILGVGDRLDAAQLVGVEIDAVHFELDGSRFRIAIGQTLQDRRPSS